MANVTPDFELNDFNQVRSIIIIEGEVEGDYYRR